MAHGRGQRAPYYIAARLISEALDEWNSFHGWCLARGIKPLKLTYAELLDLVLHWLTEGATEESLVRFERDLTMPPPNTEIRQDDPIWGADAEMAMFAKAKRKG